MRTFTASLLVATALCGASPAAAASYLAFDFYAKGTGTEFIGSRTGTTPNMQRDFNQFSGTLYYNLEGSTPPQTTPTGISYAGLISTPVVLGQTAASGFNFQAFTPFTSGFISYAINGSACFGNTDPFSTPTGAYATDPSCSAITANYSDGFAIYGYDFTGIVQSVNFRIVEAETIPDITFSIPEPSTWALMLAGFGMVGYAMRRRRVAFAHS